jgi:hypothetical protein
MERGKELITGTPEDLTINERLTNFFQCDGVLFDEQTGLFCINNPITNYIGIKGHGKRFDMACKALRRVGIDATEDCKSAIAVNVTEESFEIICENRIIAEAVTIEDLLKRIKEII